MAKSSHSSSKTMAVQLTKKNLAGLRHRSWILDRRGPMRSGQNLRSLPCGAPHEI